MKKTKEMPFSEVRRNFTAVIDQVEKNGAYVTILRHGKPTAVVMNYQDYQLHSQKRRPFKLAGSLKFRKGLNLDKAIRENRKAFKSAMEKRARRLLEELGEP